MQLIKGTQYLYSNKIRVGRNCKKVKREIKVKYIGSEGNNEVFETEYGTEILLNVNDIETFISILK